MKNTLLQIENDRWRLKPCDANGNLISKSCRIVDTLTLRMNFAGIITRVASDFMHHSNTWASHPITMGPSLLERSSTMKVTEHGGTIPDANFRLV
jgi:hypothetical protein